MSEIIPGLFLSGPPILENVNIWVIRNHEKYKNHTAKELGKLYVGFYTEGKLKKESR